MPLELGIIHTLDIRNQVGRLGWTTGKASYYSVVTATNKENIRSDFAISLLKQSSGRVQTKALSVLRLKVPN